MAIGTGPLAGRVVIVAGATGAVGGALARHLHERGARIGLPVRRPWQAEQLASTFGTEGVLVGCVPAQDGEAAAGFVQGASSALGPIDALLCASGAFRYGDVGSDPAGELAQLLEANLLAPALLARAVVGPMKRRRTGSLVFVGSAAVGAAGAGTANYLASKAALHEWVRALAIELRDSGVRAGAVLPGIIDTAANRQAMPDADRARWHAVDAVVRAMVRIAFEPQSASGPLLYALPQNEPGV